MKRSDFEGTGKVFSFTLTQYLKNKSTIAMLVIMVVMSAICVFIMAGSTKDMYQFDFNANQLVIVNETELDIRGGDITAYSQELKDVKVGFERDAGTAKAVTAGNSSAVIIHINEEGGIFYSSSDPGEAVNDYSVSLLSEALSDAISAARFRAEGISDEQMEIAFAQFSVGSMSYDEYLSPKDEAEGLPGGMGYFMLSYLYSIIILILVMFSTSYLVRSVVEEKASKLVELLMVSVRPLALLLGKILATMLFMVISIFVLVLGAAGSSLLAGRIFGGAGGLDILAGSGIEISFAGVGVVYVLVMLISIVLGYLTFSLMAGISGATCSTMEDINSATTIVSLLALSGYMTAIITALIGNRTVLTILSLCPIISVFSAPVSYMTGVINIWVLLLSWVIQIATAAGLAAFGARVYSALLIHRGNRIKLGQLFRIARESKKEA